MLLLFARARNVALVALRFDAACHTEAQPDRRSS
jgi:hypothetical protein